MAGVKFVPSFASDIGRSILSSYSLREDRTHELMTHSLHFVFVELDRFNKKWEDIDNDRERFYFCIRHLHMMKDLPDGFTEGIWAKLARQSELAEMPARVKTNYIRTMTTEIDRRAQDKYARRIAFEEAQKFILETQKVTDEAQKAALEEKMAVLEEKLEERMAAHEAGLAEGRAEAETNLVTIMLSNGMSASAIANVTGLNIKRVEKIASNRNG